MSKSWDWYEYFMVLMNSTYYKIDHFLFLFFVESKHIINV